MTNDEHREWYTRLMVEFQALKAHPEALVRMTHADLMALPLACPGRRDGMYRIIIAAMIAHFRQDWRN